MWSKLNPHFYRTLPFWLGVLCILAELVIWRFDSQSARLLGVGTGFFLILLSFDHEPKDNP
ncbi:hypothetical protein [Levilactobacillus yonginensis]